MEDFVKTIKAQLYDRISSPLLFSLGASWLIWNYKIVIILLSSTSPQDKFFLIDLLGLHWNEPEWYWALHLALGPIATASIYIFLVPWIEKIVFKFTLQRKRELKELRRDIEDDSPITSEEAEELRAMKDALYVQHRSALRERDEEIASLKVELRELKERASSTSQVPADVTPPRVELSSTQKDVLRVIAENSSGGTFTTFDDLDSQLHERPIRIQYDIDALFRLKFIELRANQRPEGYELSMDGRAYCIEELGLDLV